MKQILEQLLIKQNLTRDESFNVMLSIMSGEFDDAQIALWCNNRTRSKSIHMD
jgi:anthranilate phosphoribosyltransferase